MARPPRLEFPGALYHLTSRGNARKRIFHDDAGRERFLEQLAYCLEAHSVILYAYVLMGNHYHLPAQTRTANLSAFSGVSTRVTRFMPATGSAPSAMTVALRRGQEKRLKGFPSGLFSRNSIRN